MFECSRHVDHRKVAGGETVGEAAECECDEDELRARGRLGESHQDGVAPLRSEQRQRALR